MTRTLATAVEKKRTTCNRDCPDACGIIATVEDGRITRLQGDPDHPVTQGFLCYRTSHFLNNQYDPKRLTTPLLRDAQSGKLVPVSWEVALDTAAQALLRIREESGPAAIFSYRSGGTLGVMGAVVDLFFEQFGPVTTKRGDICSGAGDAAQDTDFGQRDSNDLHDLHHAKHILVWGKNVWVSSPHTIPVLKEARARGARLTLIDPVWHRTATLCERYIQPRPGGDFALAMAVAQVLAAQGWLDPLAMTRCDHVAEFLALCQHKTLEQWLTEADATREQATALAEALHDKPCAILIGWGMGRRKNGSAIIRALDALAALTGNLGISGGGASYYFYRRAAFDTSFLHKTPPRTICEPLFGQDLLAQRDPPVRAVWITAGNPVAMLPESQKIADALRSREFVVVVDSWLSDTAECATLVLPTTTLLEADDLLGAYGHHYLAAARPVVAPPAGVKSDLEIMQDLAARVGLSDVVAGSARDWQAKIAAPKLAPHGITLRELEAGPVRSPLAPQVLFADGKFPTETGRVNLIHEPPVEPATVDAEYPLLLLSLSTEKSQSSVWADKPQGPATVTVHPDAVPGLADGAIATLQSHIGSMTIRIQHDDKQRRDVALIAKGGHLRDGSCANVLIRAALTDAGEGGALYDEPVRILPGRLDSR